MIGAPVKLGRHRLRSIVGLAQTAIHARPELADPDLYTFTGGSPPTPQELRARYERWTAGSPDPAVSWCNWVIQLHSPQCLAGTVQATISTGGDQPAAEVAWVVGRPWQGRGIATEAVRALISWLQRQSIHTVIAHIHPATRHPPQSPPQPASPPPITGKTEK
jgi:RimJ/RimL family protein N-acetyltransferase